MRQSLCALGMTLMIMACGGMRQTPAQSQETPADRVPGAETPQALADEINADHENVTNPTVARIGGQYSLDPNTGSIRPMRKMPALTMVAACR